MMDSASERGPRRGAEGSTRRLMRACEVLCDALAEQRFALPVTHVYNPLEYARAPHFDYLSRYAGTPKRAVYLGMNPGPFGMAQTGVPFGEVALVRDYLGVRGEVHRPKREHDKRPIHGFACERSEVSGARLWGAIRAKYPDPTAFFEHSFVANYCPLVFMEETGRNRTPDKLAPRERQQLYAACDAHLRELIEVLQPAYVIGVGKFAESRAREALGFPRRSSVTPVIGCIPHPSPASPAANKTGFARVGACLSGVDMERSQRSRSPRAKRRRRRATQASVQLMPAFRPNPLREHERSTVGSAQADPRARNAAERLEALQVIRIAM